MQIRSSVKGEKVLLQPQQIQPGSHIGNCTCWLRGHCKHVAATLLAVSRSASKARLTTGHQIAEPSDKEARKQRDEIEARLMQRTTEELRSLLRSNNMLVCGAKPAVARRIADAVIFGVVQACPNCGGHLHSSSDTDSPNSMYSCRK